LGLGMGMGISHWEWEGMGLKWYSRSSLLWIHASSNSFPWWQCENGAYDFLLSQWL